MPVRRSRLTKSEEAQFRSSLSYLKQIGIGIGSVEDHSLLGSKISLWNKSTTGLPEFTTWRVERLPL